MKSLNKKIFIALLFMLTLILPMSISVVHAFHQHENNLCLAENESHIHSETSDCDQLHYFSQTIDFGESKASEISCEKILIQNQFYSEFELIRSFSKADPDRGPPVITVF